MMETECQACHKSAYNHETCPAKTGKRVPLHNISSSVAFTIENARANSTISFIPSHSPKKNILNEKPMTLPMTEKRKKSLIGIE